MKLTTSLQFFEFFICSIIFWKIFSNTSFLNISSRTTFKKLKCAIFDEMRNVNINSFSSSFWIFLWFSLSSSTKIYLENSWVFEIFFRWFEFKTSISTQNNQWWQWRIHHRNITIISSKLRWMSSFLISSLNISIRFEKKENRTFHVILFNLMKNDFEISFFTFIDIQNERSWKIRKNSDDCITKLFLQLFLCIYADFERFDFCRILLIFWSHQIQIRLFQINF